MKFRERASYALAAGEVGMTNEVGLATDSSDSTWTEIERKKERLLERAVKVRFLFNPQSDALLACALFSL